MTGPAGGLPKGGLTAFEAGNISPLVLAFVGDAAYELVIRTILVRESHARPNELNRRKAGLVNAAAQSAMAGVIAEQLTEAEASVYRRGRNARTDSIAKHAKVGDYRRATGFESLMGYLYLSGQTERMTELILAGLRGLRGESEP